MAGSCTWWVQRRMTGKCSVYQIQLYETYNRLHKCNSPKGFLLTLSQNGFTWGIPIHQRVLQIKDLSSGVNPLHIPANTASLQSTPTEVLGISAKNLTCQRVGCWWEGNTGTWDIHEAPPLQPLSPHLCSEDHLELRDLIQIYRIAVLCAQINLTFHNWPSGACPPHMGTIGIHCTETHWFVNHSY